VRRSSTRRSPLIVPWGNRGQHIVQIDGANRCIVHAHAVQPAIAKKRRIRQTIGQLFSTVSAHCREIPMTVRSGRFTSSCARRRRLDVPTITRADRRSPHISPKQRHRAHLHAAKTSNTRPSGCATACLWSNERQYHLPRQHRLFDGEQPLLQSP
jgi:hypothetical protein